MPDTWMLITIFLAAGLVIGITGFGAGLVAMGVLANIMPVAEATVIVSVLVLFGSALNLWDLRHHVLWPETWPILATSFPSVLLGVYLLTHLDADILRAGVAVMILAGCGLMLWSPKGTQLRRAFPWGYVAGVLGGTFGGALTTGGPPVVLYSLLRGWDKSAAKGVMSAYFLIMGAWRLAALLATGVATTSTIRLGLILLVPAMTASYLGMRLFQRLSNEAFRYATIFLLIGLAVKLLVA